MALNFQTRDDPLMLNYGFFEDNGACGYVLKPEFMRSPTSDFSQNGSHPGEWTQILTVRVISGYKLPKKRGDSERNIVDPYIRVSSCVCMPVSYLFSRINRLIKKNNLLVFQRCVVLLVILILNMLLARLIVWSEMQMIRIPADVTATPSFCDLLKSRMVN